MTKYEALYKFFNSFEIPAYPSTAVPSDAAFPWLTYENTLGSVGDNSNTITVNLWYHTESESIPNAKVDEIGDYIGMGGRSVLYDGGAIWIKKGTPWSTAMTDDVDRSVKRRLLNVELELL